MSLILASTSPARLEVLRAAGIEPKGEAWRRAKAGEPVETIAADMAA